MLSRLIPLSLAAVCLLFLAACSEPAKPVETPAKQPTEAEVEAPVVMTGRVVFDGISMDGVTLREVIVVSEIAPKTRATLEEQRALFEAKINPQAAPAEPAVKAASMSEEDAREINAKLLELRGGYPQMIVEEKNIGNGRMLEFRSNPELFYGFAGKFKEITPENMTAGIEAIGAEIQTVGQRIVDGAEGQGDRARLQADTDLAWLKMLHDYLKTYIPLNRKVSMAIQRYAREQGTSVGADLSTWEGFAHHHSVTLMSEVYSMGLDETELEADGSFDVTATGTLVVRLEYGLYSAYFLPESPNETRVSIVEKEYTAAAEK